MTKQRHSTEYEAEEKKDLKLDGPCPSPANSLFSRCGRWWTIICSKLSHHLPPWEQGSGDAIAVMSWLVPTKKRITAMQIILSQWLLGDPLCVHSSCIRLTPHDDKGKIYTISCIFSHFIHHWWERDEGANSSTYAQMPRAAPETTAWHLKLKTQASCESSDSLVSGGLFFSAAQREHERKRSQSESRLFLTAELSGLYSCAGSAFAGLVPTPSTAVY